MPSWVTFATFCGETVAISTYQRGISEPWSWVGVFRVALRAGTNIHYPQHKHSHVGFCFLPVNSRKLTARRDSHSVSQGPALGILVLE